MINSSSEGKHGKGGNRRMTKVTYGWMVTILSYLRVDDGYYTKLPMGRCIAKVAYGWTVTTLSHL